MGCSGGKASQKAGALSPLPRADSRPRGSKNSRSSKGSRHSSNTVASKEPSIHDMCSTVSMEGGSWTVMEKYRMSMKREDIMGEGSSSICRRAICLQSGEPVAIKVYKKHSRSSSKREDIKLQKFQRQIQVLKELQEPFKDPGEPVLWTDQLENAKPHRLFLQLLDFSSGPTGIPGPDPRDNILYVVTEIAQYSLKDYLALRRDQGKQLPRDSIKCITKAIITVMAGLHSKGLVHMDLKPENLMMFNGRLKLIDVDGCVRLGTSVCIQDASISFSPCYCAPEWAAFLIADSETRITAKPSLDAWSVGMTLCELVTLDPLLKATYANFLHEGYSSSEAGFFFMEWLSTIDKAPLPRSVEQFDSDFANLLVDWLLVFDHQKRSSCAQCLSHPYLASEMASEGRKSGRTTRCETSDSSLKVIALDSVGCAEMNCKEGQSPTACELISVKPCGRMEDSSSFKPAHKGVLYKLDAGGDPSDPIQWRRRDMWISSNGSLCYFSIKDNRRLVLIEGSKLMGARISPYELAGRKHAFSVQPRGDEDESPIEGLLLLASESEEDYKTWTQKLQTLVSVDQLMITMRLGDTIKDGLDKFRLSVKNRRKEINDEEKDCFAPVFKGTLWKVKSEGDRKRQEDWFEREMWLAKNGSLVYWSMKEGKQLVYYTSDDIMKASVQMIPNTDSFRPWTFAVQLPSLGDIEFAPGEFAAESQEMREKWVRALVQHKAA